jgi:hypothetical protein
MVMYKGDITMTTNLIRKQIYISPLQQAKLRLLAKKRGVSEAEIIRQAIDREAEITTTAEPAGANSALEEIFRFAAERRAKYADVPAVPYHFNREDIYEERENQIVSHLRNNDESNPD